MRFLSRLMIPALLASACVSESGGRRDDIRAEVLAQDGPRILEEAKSAVIEAGLVPLSVELRTTVVIFREGDQFDVRIRVRTETGCRYVGVMAVDSDGGDLAWSSGMSGVPCL